MASITRSLVSKSIAFRKASALPRPSLTSAKCIVNVQFPATFQARRFNSTESSAREAVGAVGNVADVATTSSALEQATALLAENATAAVTSFEELNFVTRSVMELIDHVHNFVGIPYWEAIALTTVCVRILIAPIAIKTTQGAARLTHLRPVMQKITDAMKNDPRADDLAVKMRYQEELKASFVKYKVNPIHAVLWPLAQMPVFLSLFFGIQSMGTYFPGLADGGALWFSNLAIPDATYAFPIINAISFLAMIEIGAQDGVSTKQTKMVKDFMRFAAVATIPLTSTIPQSVFVFWTTNNVISLTQGFLLKRPSVKKFLDIPEPPPQDKSEIAADKGIFERLGQALENKSPNAANARSEVLDGLARPKASVPPPPKTFSAPPKKSK